LKLDKIYIIIGLLSSSIYAQNLNYAVNDIHTLTVPKGKVSISLSKQLMNDTVDVLKIKESEFGNNSKFDAIGDLDGNAIRLRYGISDKLMLNLNYEKQNIQYSDNTMTNTKEDIYLRYNIFQYQNTVFNSGISIDVGYVRNKLDDFYLRDLTQINELGQKLSKKLGVSEFKLQESPLGGYELIDSKGAPFPLKDNPWIALKDTSDESKYIRLLTGFYTKQSTMDFFVGLKTTEIKNIITTNNELLIGAKTKGYDLEQNLARSEKMYMAGFNYSVEHNKFLYEFGFEYDKFIRDDGLDYIDFNYIFDMNITRYINENLSIFVGTKIMYRQLNGQIPYLYNEHTQTSYDHKYGYANAGIQFNF
jgi:hypothetical protein